jgi:hypothetical protein
MAMDWSMRPKVRPGEVGVQPVVLGRLGGGADLGHLFHGFQRVFACSRLGAEHHGVGAVEHGIGHVAHLGTGGHRVGDHAFHHLRGGDDHLVELPRHADHLFLQRRHGRVAHFHRQVAARHHDAVADAQDGLQVRNGLGTLDFGNQPRLVAVFGCRHVAQLARHFHVGRVLGEAHRHIVGLKTHGRADVLHVLGGQRRALSGRRPAC